MNEQVALEKRWDGLTEVDIYGKPESAGVILGQIEQAARAEPVDASTAKGRASAVSKAATVSRIKVRMDGMGKDMVAGAKLKIRAVDQSRKLLRDGLDALRDETRAPVTEFERAEAERVARIQAAIGEVRAMATEYDCDGVPAPLAELKRRREDVGIFAVDDTLAEFATDAAIAKDQTIRTLDALIAKLEKAEAEAAELERLRKAEEARAQSEREAKVKAAADKAIADAEKAAADKARSEAEAKATADAIAAKDAADAKLEDERKAKRRAGEQAKEAADEAKRKAEAKLNRERQAKRDAEAATERAKLEGELAVKRDRERVAAAALAQQQADDKRAANEEHRSKVIRMAAEALNAQTGIDLVTASAVVDAIADDSIPNVTINF